MRDKKKYIEMPEQLPGMLEKVGYREVLPQDQTYFDPFYDEMNDFWTSCSSFPTFIGWDDSFRVYVKEAEGMLINLFYLYSDGSVAVGPFLGRYENERVAKVLAIVEEDLAFLGHPLVLMDIAKWMVPYYESGGMKFEIEDDRDIQEYFFTAEEFMAGMDAQDDRYRYRYFKRKYNYETIEITPEHRKEIYDFMEAHWCEGLDCSYCHFGCLKKVIDNIVRYFDILRVHGIMVKIDGELAGICIVSCRNGLGIYQYKNTINRIKGLTEYLLRECFDRFMGEAKAINYTEDLGIENLRYNKMHLAPSYSLFSRLTLKKL